MAPELSRSFIINRAVAADKWLTTHAGTTLMGASSQALEGYLATLPESLRDRSWRALIMWGDDMIRRGALAANIARDLVTEIDLREAEAAVGDEAQPRRNRTRAG